MTKAHIDPLGAEIWRLAEMFPGKATDDRKRIYYEKIKAEGFEFGDISEAINRIENTRHETTFPPFAVLLERCREVRGERIGVERTRLLGDGLGAQSFATESGRAHFLSEFRKFRAQLKAGELDPYGDEKPYEGVQATPVRGAPISSPAYRSQRWWSEHPQQPTGRTLRGLDGWIPWHKDLRPWSQAEAEHARHTRSPLADIPGMTQLSEILSDLKIDRAEKVSDEAPFEF